MQAMSLNFALAPKEKKALQPVKIKAKDRAIDVRVIIHINDTLNDSQKFLMQVYEKSYNTCT